METRRLAGGRNLVPNDYHNKIEAGYAPIGQSPPAVTTNIYQWENVPKAVVEGLEGSLNVPVSNTINWTNNITYMLQSKNKEPATVCQSSRRLAELNPELAGTPGCVIAVNLHLVRQAAAEEIQLQGPASGWSGPERSQPVQHRWPERDLGHDQNVSLTGGVDNVFDNASGAQVMPNNRKCHHRCVYVRCGCVYV
ncbi:hypothetical protein ACNKHO_03260 [Shigella flexneri]